jgi:hypothetical protein
MRVGTSAASDMEHGLPYTHTGAVPTNEGKHCDAPTWHRHMGVRGRKTTMRAANRHANDAMLSDSLARPSDLIRRHRRRRLSSRPRWKAHHEAQNFQLSIMLRLLVTRSLCRRWSVPCPPPPSNIRVFSSIKQTDFEALRDLMLGIKSDVASFKSEVKSDVASLKSDMSEVKSDVGSLKSDMSEVKSDVGSLKSDMSEVKSDLARFHIRIRSLELGHTAVPVQHPISVFIQCLERIVQKELEPVREAGGRWSKARTLTLPDNAAWPTISDSVLYQRYFYEPFYDHVLNELRPSQSGRNPMQVCLIGSPGIGAANGQAG